MLGDFLNVRHFFQGKYPVPYTVAINYIFVAGPADGSRGNTSTASTSGEYVGGGGDASAAMLVAAAAVGMEENSEEIQVNGHAASPQDEVEVTLADLPSVLNVADPVSHVYRLFVVVSWLLNVLLLAACELCRRDRSAKTFEHATMLR